MAKPTVTKGVVKPKTGQAGLYGGLGPNAYVNQLFAPQEQATAQQQASRQAVFQGLVKDFLDSINGVGKQLAPYTAAAGQQSSDAKNAAAGLAAANPNAVTQNDLRAIGAPQSQQDAVTAQNQTAFGGNAALLNYTGGVIPSDQFRSDAAARASYLGALPAIGESIGLHGLSGLNSLASKENLALQGNKTQALQTARTDLANYVQKNQAAKVDAAKTAFSQNLATQKYNTGIDEFNARQTMSQARMDQSAYQFSTRMLNSDRSYKLALDSLGLRTSAAKRKATIDEYKLANGGLSESKVVVLKGDAAAIAQDTFNGFTDSKTNKKYPPLNLGQALTEMRKGAGNGSVPISIALKALKQAGYKVPKRYDKLMGGLSQSATPFASTGSVSVAPGANRAGFNINPNVTAFVSQISAVAGVPLTITTGTNHNEYVLGTHRVSDHWDGNASDIAYGHGSPGHPDPALTRLGQDALIAAGMPEALARKQTGGLYNIGNKQIIFNSMEGGNHYNHLHVGVR